MSVSWTLFDAGSHGTWLNYFINSHPEHAKANLNIELNTKKQNNIITDYGVTGSEWTIGDSFTPPKKGKVNLKIFPAHCLYKYEEQYEQLLKDTQCEKVIIVDTKSGIMLDKMKKRMRVIKPEWKDEIETHFGSAIHLEPYLEQSSVPCHYVDIGKILTNDEKEYKLMLEFLDERPLANWNDYVQRVHDDIYEGYL
tara:strand:- start:156 stop:743 length:588 start_codon:yes stop_codon:yes gene_type:complete